MFTNPICHWAGGAKELLSLDFTTPVEQPFPQSSAEMVALGLPAPTSIYDFNEAAGNVLDHVGANDLTPVNNPMQNQKAVGLWTGSSLATKRAGEFLDNTNAAFNAANNAIFDRTTDSVAIMFAMRSLRPGGVRQIITKRDAGGLFAGYELSIAANGQLTLTIDDGVAAPVTVTLAVDMADAAWHCVLMVIDRNAASIALYTDFGTNSAVIPGPVASLTNADIFSAGDGTTTSFPGQIAFAAVWLSAAAEGMGAADLANFITHGDDPAQHNPALTALTTKVHASMIWDRVAAGKVGGWNANQLPIGWNGGLSNANKMGLRCASPLTNMLSESDDFLTTWTTSNVTPSSAAADLNDSPRGFRESFKLTADANNGYLQHQVVTVASTRYSLAAFLKRDKTMGADVSGRLVAYDISNGAEITSVAFTAGEDWGDEDWTPLIFTTPVGCVSCGFRIEIDTSGEVICAALATFVGDHSVIPIYTTGGTSTVATTDWRAAEAGSDFIKGAAGERETVVICDTPDVNSPGTGFIGHASGVGNNDCNFTYRSCSQKFYMRIYNTTGTSIVYKASGNTFDLSLEHKLVSQWNSSTPIKSGKYARLFVDGVEEASYSTGGWTSGDTTTQEVIGGSGNSMFGLIATSKIYAAPQTDL